MCVFLVFIEKASKQIDIKTLQTSLPPSWRDFVVDFCLYRSTSHFGYRIPRKMWIPKQFHFPESITALPTVATTTYHLFQQCYSKSMSNHQSIDDESDTVACGQNVRNDMHMSMPSIKCSLCKSSTPSKQNANQFENDMYESIMLDVSSDISSFSSDIANCTHTDINDANDVQSHGDHCANRFVVRIFAQSK